MTLSKEEIGEISKTVADKVLKEILLHQPVYHEPETIQQGLTQSMGEEMTANIWYRNRAKHAEVNKDSKTAELYKHIADEEAVHLGELGQRLHELVPASITRAGYEEEKPEGKNDK